MPPGAPHGEPEIVPFVFLMVMLVRPEHSLKASSPMEVTEFGMVMLVRLEHSLKAPPLMEVTEAGMVMLVRLEQPQKAQ